MKNKNTDECVHCCEHEHSHEHECEHEHEHNHEHSCACGHEHGHSEGINVKRTVLKYIFGAVPTAVGFMSFIPYHIPLIAALLGYAFFGFEVYREMLEGFAKKKIFTEFTLMCVATLGAFAIGEYADAAAVMYLYSLGETVSDGAYSRSKKNISELLEITPEYANVLRNGELVSVSPRLVEPGELVTVRSGERVPLDGVVVEGGGNADTSSVTGEEKPLELYAGIECPSGSLLEDGCITVRVLKKYENSVVARLSAAVAEAGKRKSASEKKISRFAAVFTPVAFAVSVGIFAVGAIITGNVAAWLRVGITVLVVSCPCSLVLSVPLTYFAGMGSAASRGMIFRGGEVMDRTARIGAVAFDKTGTLTSQHLSFDGVKIYGSASENEFLSMAKAVLTYSPHAAAVSFCAECELTPALSVSGVDNISGRGIVCDINGKRAVFGNVKLMEENGIHAEPCDVTCIYGAYDGELLGRLEFSSHIKDGTAEAVRKLKRLGTERIAVISGDSEKAVADVCRAAEIEEYYSACAPDTKLEIFEKIKKEQSEKGQYAAYCGDGLNDSAVITSADVGIAMGNCGSALTVENADIVLMDDKPEKIADAIKISRRTARIASSNIALSLGIKLAVLAAGTVFTCLGMEMPIELAVVADVGAAVLTVLNALRASKTEKI